MLRAYVQVKLLPDFSELFISQVTWSGFDRWARSYRHSSVFAASVAHCGHNTRAHSMLRAYKLYDFPFTRLDGSSGEQFGIAAVVGVLLARCLPGSLLTSALARMCRPLPSSVCAVPSVQSSFSSYPASISSADDFYQLSSGLVVQETTIGVYDGSLYKKVRVRVPHALALLRV